MKRSCKATLSNVKIFTKLPLKHVLVGLAIRELLAPWTGHPYDFEIWVRLGVYMQTGGSPYIGLSYLNGTSFAPYSTIGSISYPPLSAFLFAAVYRLYLVLEAPTRFFYYFLLKQPMIISDILIAILIFKMVSAAGNQTWARRGALIWLYLPFTIIVSSVWGALDPIALALILSALYFFNTAKYERSALALGFAIFLKTMPAVFVPIFLMQHGISGGSRVRFLGLALGVPIIGTIVPYMLLGWGFTSMYNAFSYQAAIPVFGAMSALRILSFVPGLSADTSLAIGILWLPAVIASYVFVRMKRLSLPKALMVTTLMFSISRPFLPEQWTLYPLAFLLLYDESNLKYFASLAGVATAFLITNNTLLVRFLSPLTSQAFAWDIYVNNFSSFYLLRDGLATFLAVVFFIEAVSAILGRRSYVFSLASGVLQHLRTGRQSIRPGGRPP